MEKDRSEAADLIEQQLLQGDSLLSSHEHVELDRFQNITITERPPKRMKSEQSDLSPEEKTIKHLKETGELKWFTSSKAEKLEEMDFDFKLLAAIHTLKQANKHHNVLQTYNEEFVKKHRHKLKWFMEILGTIEDHLYEEYGIILPETEEELRDLRQKFKTLKSDQPDESV